VGLIAGGGELPLLTARGIRAAGRPVVCVGLVGQYDPALPARCDRFARAGVARLGRWVRLLRRWGASEAVLIGGVSKARMYRPLVLLRHLPDLRTLRLWYASLRHDRRDAALLHGLAEELQRSGVTLLDSTRHVADHLAPEGVLTKRAPTEAQRADIAFAQPVARRLGELDIGQSLAVRDRAVIAVEAMEGTDALIERAGALCPSGWSLLKMARPGQDMRFDAPTVGERTIEHMRAAGGGCLAVEAGKVVFVDRAKVLAAADRAGIAVVGIGTPSA
jgi:DUF1009 family protein